MMISHNNLIYYYPMITLSTTSADNIAQQILSTSLYLLRLVDDIYNRPAATNLEALQLYSAGVPQDCHGDNGKIFFDVWNWRI
jgi:hypothetical protein